MFITFVAIIVVGWITEESVADFMNFLPKCLTMRLLFKKKKRRGHSPTKTECHHGLENYLYQLIKMAMSLFQEHKDRSKLEKLINLISEKKQKVTFTSKCCKCIWHNSLQLLISSQRIEMLILKKTICQHK